MSQVAKKRKWNDLDLERLKVRVSPIVLRPCISKILLYSFQVLAGYRETDQESSSSSVETLRSTSLATAAVAATPRNVTAMVSSDWPKTDTLVIPDLQTVKAVRDFEKRRLEQPYESFNCYFVIRSFDAILVAAEETLEDSVFQANLTSTVGVSDEWKVLVALNRKGQVRV